MRPESERQLDPVLGGVDVGGIVAGDRLRQECLVVCPVGMRVGHGRGQE